MLDGVLDNRKELARQLGLPCREVSDADLALESYRRWGEGFAAHLLGEFAVVVWDGLSARLLAARDPFGVRQLFYRSRCGRLEMASQAWQLIDGRSATLSDVDLDYIADFLSCQISIKPYTPFVGVTRLMAGHTLVASASGIRIHRHYDLAERSPAYACQSPEDYAERFRELFAEAVDRSLATPGKVWAELSGGLDSSSIVSMVHHLQQQQPRKATNFGTVTLAWPETRRSDESAWAKMVAETFDLEHHVLPCDDAFFDGAEQAAFYRSEPHFGMLCLPMHRQEVDLLQTQSVDVVLSGSRAESVILDNYAPIHLADLLRTGRLPSLFRLLSAWQKALAEPLLNILYWSCVRPLIRPKSLDENVELRMRVPDWVDAEFSDSMHLKDRIGAHVPQRFRSVARQYQYENLARSEQMIHRGLVELSVEVRYPFLYRPLVEHCFFTPWEIKHKPGWHKSLLRDGLRDVLPKQIVHRRDCVSPTPAAFKSLQRRWPTIQRLGEDSWLGRLGVVDVDRFCHSLELARHGSSPNFVALTSALAAEYWLRAHLGGEAIEVAV